MRSQLFPGFARCGSRFSPPLLLFSALAGGLATLPAQARVWYFGLQGQAGIGLLAGNQTMGVAGTPGSGEAIGGGIHYDDVTRVLTLSVGWGSGQGFSADLSGNALAAYVHGPTANHSPTSYQQNAPVALVLSSAPFAFNASASSGSVSGSSAPLTLAQQAELLAGRWYINVTTALNPAGEIRGNLVPFASNFWVTQTGNAGEGTLRQALLNAAATPQAETITFSPGLSGATLTLTSEIVISDSAPVIVDASSLAQPVTIQGNSSARLFSVPTGKNLTLRGLRLTGGGGAGSSYSGFGGAILNQGFLELDRCELSGNSATYGGGVTSISDASLAWLNARFCTFSGNTATQEGGAVSSQSFSHPDALALANLESCALYDNSAPYGGAVALLAQNGLAFLSIWTSTLARNIATGSGSGGAVKVYADEGEAELVVTSCTVVGNQAASGGGIHSAQSATGSAKLRLGSSILAHNIAFTGTNVQGSALSDGSNFIGDDSGLTLSAALGDQIGTADVPLLPRLGPLASNGGPTLTIAPLPGSPVLDAGDVSPDLDQRGFPRIRDGNGDGVAKADIGAFETQAPRMALGFNFRDGSVVPNDQLSPGDFAGVPDSAQSHWNNLSGPDSGARADRTPRLSAQGNTLSELETWWQAPNTWLISGTAATPDHKLMFGYLDSNGSGEGGAAANLRASASSQPYFGVANLPAELRLGGYDVLVYADGDTATEDRVSSYWLTTNQGLDPTAVGGELERAGRVFLRDAANFSGTYTRATAVSNAGPATVAANFVRFENQTDPALWIRAEEHGGSQLRAPINAVQFIRNEVVVVTTALDELDPPGTLGAGLSLREALRDAPPGGGILFDPTVFNGSAAAVITNSLGQFTIIKDVVVDASSATAPVEIRGFVSGGITNRHFYISGDYAVTLRGLRLHRGGGNGGGDGGAIRNLGRLRLIGCTLSENIAAWGGAITSPLSAATLWAESCTFLNNRATGSVGGAINTDGRARLEDCLFQSNQAGNRGGAIQTYTSTSEMRILRCQFLQNSAANAGAINAYYPLFLEDSSFDQNQATAGNGGAVRAYGTLEIRGSTFVNNTATNQGGALWVAASTNAFTAVNSTFQGNDSAEGGAIRTVRASSLTQVTITDNGSSPGAGGGVWFSSSLAITNTLVAANAAGSGADLFKSGLSASITAGGNNLIGDNGSVEAEFPYAPLVGTTANPLNPVLGLLQDNGGYARTRAPQVGSPARNNAVDTGSLPATDQRGLPRILGGAPDIGAVEESSTYAAPYAADGTWNVYLVGPAFQTFMQAEAWARAQTWNGVRGHLVAIQSAAENEFVRLIAGSTWCWVGLSDHESFGGMEAGSNPLTGWVWMGGESGSYRNWAPGQPDNSGAASEDAVMMRPDGLWQDVGLGDFDQSIHTPRGVVVEFETRSPNNPFLDPLSAAAGTTGAVPLLPPYPLRQGCAASEGRFRGTHLANLAVAPRHLTEAGRVLWDQGPGGGVQTDGAVSRINLADPDSPGSGGAFTGDTPFLVDLAGDDNQFATVFRSRLRVRPGQAGLWTFQLRGDDGCALRLPGQLWREAAGVGWVDPADPSTLAFPEPTGDAFTFGVVELTEGDVELEFVAYDFSGGAYTELSAAPGVYPPAGDYKLVGDPAGLELVGPPGYLAFNGVDDYVEVNGTGVLLGQNFTQELWIYPQQTDANFHGVLGHQPAGGANARAPSLWIHNHRRLHYGFGTGSSWQATITPNDVLVTNSWNHVALTYDATQYRLYVNGTQVHAFTPAGPSVDTPVKWMGRVDNYFRGRMDEVRLWTVARTPEQIRADMHRTLVGNEPGLAAYWRFDMCDSPAPPSIGPGWGTTVFGSLTQGVAWRPAPQAVYTHTLEITPSGSWMGFFGEPDRRYRVWGTHDVTLPILQWTYLGLATGDVFGQFSFLDPAATGQVRRYYRVESD
jgi:predicted outer membrane repeat protein